MTWSAGAANGGTPVIDYRISYAETAVSPFIVLASAITTTSYSTTALTSGEDYVFKVEARNAYGYSPGYSNEVTILQAQVPDAPISLANNALKTSATQIGLTWSPGPFNGASTVIDYRISYDQGTGSWTMLRDGVTTTSYTATGLTADGVYVFKIEARNIKGYSAESSQITIRAAGIPDTPTTPTTTRNADNVDITWTAPLDGGSPIDSYTI